MLRIDMSRSTQVLRNLSRRRMKAESGLIPLSHIVTCTRKGLLFVRQSALIGSVKPTLSETGLCHAGEMGSLPNAMLLLRMTSIFGLNYMYVFQTFHHIMYSEYYDD